MKSVVDASTVLAVCNQEPGGIEARSQMRGGLISSVNLSEVYQKSLERGKLPIAKAIILTAGLTIVDFDEELALKAAEIHRETKGQGISFADRACLALGMRENLPILTGDRDWQQLKLDVQIELFRPSVN